MLLKCNFSQRSPCSRAADLLPAAVISIQQDAAGVTVATAKGTTLQAPYALVTLPLGVLKTGDVTFEPPLPAGKQAAIMQMVRPLHCHR